MNGLRRLGTLLFACGLLTWSSSPVRGDGMYTVTPLGSDRFLGLTNGGDVIGEVGADFIGASGAAGTSIVYHGYGPKAGQIERGYPKGVVNGQGGEVIAATPAADGAYHATLYNNQGGTTDLGRMPGQQFVYTAAANSSNQVAGSAQFPVPGRDSTALHTTLVANGQGRDLGTFGGRGSLPVAMNEAGQIAGQINLSNGEVHGYLWNPDGTWKDIGTPALPGVFALGMNDKGTIIGLAATETYRPNDYSSVARSVPFVYDASGMHVLAEAVDPWDHVQPNGINNLGQIVGSDTHYGAVLFKDGKMIDLDKLIPYDRDLTLLSADSINDLGQILASGRYLHSNGRYTPWTVLLTPEGITPPTAPALPDPAPVPEPTPLLVLGIAAAWYGLRRALRR